MRLRLHTGNGGVPEAQRWEAYWLDESFVMTAHMDPLVLTPLGTQVAAVPLSVVTPDLLLGNPYAPLLESSRDARLTLLWRLDRNDPKWPKTRAQSA